MSQRAFHHGYFVALLAISSLFSPGCSDAPEPDATEAKDASGSLQLALTATANGHLYRISNFQVWLYPDYRYLQSSGADDEQSLNVELPTGQHQAYLQNYAVERDDGSGNFAPVQATLISSPTLGFEILNGSQTNISFQFETDGQIVTMGAGTLAVSARVSERAAVCQPLGADCGEGAWCPPSGLTGAPLSCRAAGSVEIGTSCTAPTDCVANASCVDFGDGAVCAALCASDSFGLPCPGGGTCTASAADYGVCAP